MIVEYRVKIKGDREYYELENEPDFCCGSMKDVWKSRVIEFNSGADYQENKNVGITELEAYPEDNCYKGHDIAYCPFCGKGIDTVEVKRVKAVEKKEKVQKEVTKTEWEEI